MAGQPPAADAARLALSLIPSEPTKGNIASLKTLAASLHIDVNDLKPKRASGYDMTPHSCDHYKCTVGADGNTVHSAAHRSAASTWRNANQFSLMKQRIESELPPPQPTPQSSCTLESLSISCVSSDQSCQLQLDELNEAIASVDSSAGEETGAHEDQLREDDATPVRLRAPLVHLPRFSRRWRCADECCRVQSSAYFGREAQQRGGDAGAVAG